MQQLSNFVVAHGRVQSSAHSRRLIDGLLRIKGVEPSPLAALAIFLTGIATAAEDPADWRKYVLTPQSDSVHPVAVVESQGFVESAEALVARNGSALRLSFPKGGQAPNVLLDLGRASAGGYPAFVVKSRRGTPALRLSYSTYKGACGERGDFDRGSCTYLGADFALPILPANPGRFDLFTIPRDGKFISPMMQGQARWVRVQLESEDTEVEISEMTFENSKVHDRGPTDGWFLCDDDRLNRAWYASTWTTQIASFPNHDAWSAVDGWLMPRQLARSSDIGLSKDGVRWKDVRFSFDMEIRKNPYGVSSAGWVVRSLDDRNGYIGSIDLEGQFTLRLRKNGVDKILKQKRLGQPVVDGQRHQITVSLEGPRITTMLGGELLDETVDTTFDAGRVGFCQPREAWALFSNARVTAPGGMVLLEDDFNKGLDRWDFARTLPFVADGAKRDRLVWSGDLYWAQRNAYAAFKDASYMADSIRMLAFNQTPEGYVQACPYPENSVRPASGEYGPFPSDEFSAWFVPVVWDHYLHTGDKKLLKEIHAAVMADAAYLWRSVGTDGLFRPRPEVSKHADNLDLGDVSTRTYLNILVQDTLAKAALVARAVGDESNASRLEKRADNLKKAINSHLWNKEGGYFQQSKEDRRIGQTACALAMTTRFATIGQARSMAPQSAFLAHGKFQALMVRGLFEYGFNDRAMDSFLAHNWVKIGRDDLPETVTECMTFNFGGWGDDSHPDTGVAGIFSNYLLGIEPVTPGFATYTFAPRPAGRLRRAGGAVPSPLGLIKASWNMEKDRLTQVLESPEKTLATIAVPKSGLESFSVTVNGAPLRDRKGKLTPAAGIGKVEENADYLVLRNVAAGKWTIVTQAGEGSSFFTEAAAVDSTVAPPVDDTVWKVAARTSHEEGGWGTSALQGAPATKGDTAKGYSSKGNSRDDSEEWIEIDLGKEHALKGIVLHPRVGSVATRGGTANFPADYTIAVKSEGGEYREVSKNRNLVNPMGKPVTHNFYTVIGYPSGRYVRLKATRLGSPSVDEAATYRLQFAGVEVLW